MENSSINMNINNTNYDVNTELSLKSIKFITEPKGNNFDFKLCVANIILSSIITNDDEVLSIEDILSTDDSIYKIYIDAVIKNNDDYRKYFLQRPEYESNCEKFCNAIADYYKDLSSKIYSDRISKITQSGKIFDISKTLSLGNYSKSITDMIQSCKPMIDLSKSLPLAGYSKNINDIIQSSFPMIEASKTLAETINSIKKPLSNISEMLHKSINLAMTNFAIIQDQLLKKIKDASNVWNDIDWDALTDSYKKWGEYGWTLIGRASLSFYAEFPKSSLEADKKAMQYFKGLGIKHLFNDLRKKQKIRKNDLESVFFCFEKKQYKACAMLLCALIEAPLIKLQPIDLKDKRKVGLSAVIKLKQGKATARSVDDGKILYLSTANTISFLMSLFAETGDFKNEKNCINRNFINHGMSRREVRRKDCIKLFLGLYNTVNFVEKITEGKAKKKSTSKEGIVREFFLFRIHHHSTLENKNEPAKEKQRLLEQNRYDSIECRKIAFYFL